MGGGQKNVNEGKKEEYPSAKGRGRVGTKFLGGEGMMETGRGKGRAIQPHTRLKKKISTRGMPYGKRGFSSSAKQKGVNRRGREKKRRL